MEEVINNYKPPIFWKEKEIVKKQVKTLNYNKIQELIVQTNNIELFTKKYPNSSTHIVTNFLIDQST